MKVGDLVRIIATTDKDFCGLGLYLGTGNRGSRTKNIYTFLWRGRIATFDKPYWSFEVVLDNRAK